MAIPMKTSITARTRFKNANGVGVTYTASNGNVSIRYEVTLPAHMHSKHEYWPKLRYKVKDVLSKAIGGIHRDIQAMVEGEEIRPGLLPTINEKHSAELALAYERGFNDAQVLCSSVAKPDPTRPRTVTIETHTP